MKLAKTSVEVNTNNSDGAVAEAQRLIRNINNLLRAGSCGKNSHPEYYVDLMDDDVVQQLGRERLEQAVREVVQEPEPVVELSSKYTELLKKFNHLYFDDDPRLRNVCVEVRYWLGWPPTETTGGGEIRLVASSEAVMVRQLLKAMQFYIDQYDPIDMNQLYLREVGAPISVRPEFRHLSAEEFIAQATREPEASDRERWFGWLRDTRPEEGEAVSPVIDFWQRGGR
jgi:hypothetical protein